MIATRLCDVMPGYVEAFKITLYNHENSRRSGNIRFDLLQSNEDPTNLSSSRFMPTKAAAEHRRRHITCAGGTGGSYMASPCALPQHRWPLIDLKACHYNESTAFLPSTKSVDVLMVAKARDRLPRA